MEELARLNLMILRCSRCSLSSTRNKVVVGEGGFKKNILFIGEAPGRNEDLKGKPFVGRAGNLLNELLASIGLSRDDIYITNIIKCRPPLNRNPLKEEINACSPYLDRQLEILRPKIICTLGKFSTEYILKKYNLRLKKISEMRGKPLKVKTLFSFVLLPMFHPAAALYNPSLKVILEKDFEVLKSLLENED